VESGGQYRGERAATSNSIQPPIIQIDVARPRTGAAYAARRHNWRARKHGPYKVTCCRLHPAVVDGKSARERSCHALPLTLVGPQGLRHRARSDVRIEIAVSEPGPLLPFEWLVPRASSSAQDGQYSRGDSRYQTKTLDG
jgi:hypothetical protein